MNKIFLLLVMPLFLLAKVHYAKVEPYDSVVLKSAVSGQVIDVLLDAEGTMVVSKRVIHIDDKLDIINLEDTKISIDLVQQMLKINKEIEQSLKEIVQRQKGYYKRISKLSTASKTQKDNAYSAFTSAKTQYLSTREKILSLQKQILDMQYKVAQLKESVSQKSVILDNKYLYKLMVRTGDFVAPGSALARVDDISRAKLVLYLDNSELEDIDQKIVYLDDKKSEYKIDKIWKMADEKFISSYRAEIIIPAPFKSFSKLMKVEIK
jgi:multidrug resistance efflux pump